MAVIGVGDEQAPGIQAARQLRVMCPPQARLFVGELSASCEELLGVLRAFAPDLILLIDAVQMQGAPGAIRYWGWQDTIGLSGSQPTWSPHEIAGCLIDELGCEAALIGIQPDEGANHALLSAEVRRAVEEVAQALRQALTMSQPVSA